MRGATGKSMRLRSFSWTAILLTVTALSQSLAGTAVAQYIAWPPGERDEGVVNCATEQCLYYMGWASTGEYDNSANPTEAYIGQPEIQASVKKLKSAILKLIKKDAGDSPIAQAILENQPELFLKQAGAVFVTTVDLEKKIFSGGAVMKLGTTRDNANAIIETLVNSKSGIEFAPFEVEGAQCYSFKQGEAPTVQFGIVNDYLLLAAGELKIVDVLENMKTPQPDWLKEIDDRIKIQRQAFTCYIDIAQMIKIVEQTVNEDSSVNLEKFRDVANLLRLNDFETLQYQSGMNSDGFNQVVHLNHAKPTEGLLSAFSTEAFKDTDVAAIPEENSLAVALKLAPDKILVLAKQILKKTVSGGLGDYDDAVLQAKRLFGFDLEEDFIKALDGTVFLYADPSITSPKVVAAIRVKDLEKFTNFYDALNGQLEDSGMDVEITEKKDQTFYEVPLPNGFPICYGLVDDTLYLCNSVRGITSHLRKKDRDSGKLIQTPRFLKYLEQGKSDGFKGIVGFSEYDLRQVLEAGLPMAELMFQNAMDRDSFDFTLEDLPSVEVLVNGLRPSTSLIYRTDTGLAITAVNDLPLGIDLPTTGVLIGMLLPSVQQVRAAARRTESMNDLRQLALALINYESANGSFPPAYSVDEDGKPLLSWRVAILPFMEENELFQQFDIDEPWDSPVNLELADQMPTVFSHPGLNLAANQTVYVAPVGEDSVLSAGPNDDAGNSFGDISDGSSNTLLVIAANEKNAVVWTSPNDLQYEDLDDQQLVDATKGYLGMLTAAMCDGSIHTVGGKSVDAAGAKQIRGSFNMSDEIFFDFAP